MVEQLVQLDEEALMRLEPPPIPKQEILFSTSADPQPSQTMSFSFPAETRRSNLFPHVLQLYSNKGIGGHFTGLPLSRLIWELRQERDVEAAEVGVRGIAGESIKR